MTQKTPKRKSKKKVARKNSKQAVASNRVVLNRIRKQLSEMEIQEQELDTVETAEKIFGVFSDVDQDSLGFLSKFEKAQSKPIFSKKHLFIALECIGSIVAVGVFLMVFLQ